MTYLRKNIVFGLLGAYFLILISRTNGFLSVDLPRENPFFTLQSGAQRKASFVSSQQNGRYQHGLHQHDFVLNGPLQKRYTVAPLNLVTPSGVEWETLVTGTSHFLTAAVPTFDGNSIVDPVVVSNAFWDGITRQFVSLIIGQFLAATVFGLITTLAASQMSKLGTFMTENALGQIFFKTQKERNSSTLKQPPPGYNGPPLKVTPDIPKLLVCILIDLIGTSSELIPLVGELSDIAWAPVAALLLRSLYGGSNVIFALEFTEEILPFTDILPLATIW